MAEAAEKPIKKLPNYDGPKEGINYPLEVIYCGESGLPIELYEYAPNPDACKEWAQRNHPNLVTELGELKCSLNC
jgi:hypothetical protein